MNTDKLIVIFDTLSKYEHSIGRYFPSMAFNRVSKLLMRSSSIKIDNDSVFIDGIKLGPSSSSIIIEYLNLGHSSRYEDVKLHLNYDNLDISNISGIGEVKCEILKSIGIKSIYDLYNLHLNVGDYILNTGIRFTDMMNTGLKISLATKNKRISYNEASNLSNFVVNKLLNTNNSLNITVAGSLRRKKPTIGDLDLIVVVDENNRSEIIDQCKSIFDDIFVSGDKKISGIIKNFQIDIRFILKKEYGCHLLHATGSSEFNQKMRSLAKSKGLKLNEYCITELSTDTLHYFTSEDLVFEYLGVPYTKPEFR